jgi:hypothetical protein
MRVEISETIVEKRGGLPAGGQRQPVHSVGRLVQNGNLGYLTCL